MGYLLDNWHQRPGLDKHSSTAGSLAKEIFGIGDMQRGFNNLGQGNILKGVGQLGLGTAIGVTTLIPGAGWLARGGLMGLKGLATAARGAKAVNAAGKLNKTKKLLSTRRGKALSAGRKQRHAQKGSRGNKGAVKDGKAFNTFMKENVAYGKNITGSPYRPDNLARSAWEAGKVATFGGRQAHAWRAGRGGLDGVGPKSFNKMRIGVDEGKLRTGAGRWAARHPHMSNIGLTVGVPMAVGAASAARTGSANPFPRGRGGFNVGPLAAGRYQPAAWEQSQGGSWLR